MTKDKSYSGIDYFRLIAALLIVTIHTSPLTSFSETGDFILTRVIARAAVPFFFMTSGFFLISRYTYDNKRLGSFVKKTALLYGVAILLYLPVNLYTGYFKMDNLLPNMIKDLVFDGTLYHLWYLPASIIGAAASWYLVKKLDYPKALTVASVLYFIGLFGDSYYGFSEKVFCLSSFYDSMFQVSDYTRNGIFFAPIFFLMGGLIAEGRCKITFEKSVWGFTISLLLMLGEALVLHQFQLQRHDSMYLFLLPCSWFLFQVILCFKGKRHVNLRTVSLLIYLIHPMMILVIRMAAKLLHLENLLIENSILHYFAVCASSIVFSAAITAWWNRCKLKKEKYHPDTGRAYIEINLNNLEHNAAALQKAMPKECKLMTVVKREAYGHGAFEIASHLEKMGVDAFATATIDEAIQLRKYGIRGEILILGYTDVLRASELKKYHLTQTLIDFDYARALNSQGIAVKVHLKIDTGMHRLGIPAENFLQIKKLFSMKNLKICGMFTHLCCADSTDAEDIAFTEIQIGRFYSVVDELKDRGILVPKLHIQSSYGLMNYPNLKCDYVRAGIALYGVLSARGDAPVVMPDLRPVLSLKARVVLIRSVCKGESIGYGRSFTADKDCRIAILPIGYGDGVPRNLSDQQTGVILRGKFAPVIGRICMDQLAVDVTEIKDISLGDTATLIGSEGASEVSAPEVAGRAGTISNELLCRLGARLPVIVR